MCSAEGWLGRRLLPSCARDWDDGLLHDTIVDELRSDSMVIDLSAGARIVLKMDLRG